MIRRIGLFLGSRPSQGGTYQYCQSVLDAVAALPGSYYQRIVAYTHDGWMPSLKDCDLSLLRVSLGPWARFNGKLMSGFLPMELWRSHCLRFHPVAKVLAAQKCDLWVFPAQDTWSYLLPVPSLAVIHDLMHRYEGRFPEVGAEYRTREKHYRNTCRWAKGVLVDSRVGQMHVMESYGLDRKRIHILPFVAPKYIYSSLGDDEFEERYPVPNKFLFYPAQFWEHKNHKGLVLAVAHLREILPDLKIVFVGYRKNGYASTWKLVQELGLTERVHYFDYVPDSDMVGFYRRARAMVMPTFFGPTNIPPLEAMVLGTPTAVSGIYGMREQLGDSALYFNPASVESIAQVIASLWTDDNLCRELTAKSLKQASHWGPVHFNDRFRIVIENVLGNGCCGEF